MRYTVVWVPEVEQDLADLWMNAPDRKAVTAAADQIDDLLRTDPEQQGESRPEGRVLLIPPLGVFFHVLEQDRIVRVVQVWRFEQRRDSN
jgi:hypothetical protein